MTTTTPTDPIVGHARTVRQLLDTAKYAIDFYQREYAWQARQVHELVDDLTEKFLESYAPGHARREVARYGYYYLGAIVISHKREQRFIVDGQQRLTTLTLLLTHLHRLQAGRDDRVEVRNLIYSEMFGEKSFNLHVPDRDKVMTQLMEGESTDFDGQSESVQNITARYGDIADRLSLEDTDAALPFFVDWLLNRVYLVAIEVRSDEEAYTIFETMNDRGLSLSLPDMLKGYILANIRDEDNQCEVNDTWKQNVQRLKELGDQQDVDFFKNWLRARHAETIRPGRKGAANQDYERIGTEFHRWIRDRKSQLALTDPEAFSSFVTRDLSFYARQAKKIGHAAAELTPEWASIRYNEDRGFTLQTQVILAALAPGDEPADVHCKIALVADYLDIWLARRIWNFRTISYSSIKYTIFNVTKELRGRDTANLSAYLRQQLDEQEERFAFQRDLRWHGQNYPQIRHMLARLTDWVETECGLPSNFEDLISRGRARPFEIEHIWADRHDRFKEWFPHPSDFETARNRLGGLILLPSDVNKSLGDRNYEAKRNAYLSKSKNLLASSLHPDAYNNDPAFRRFRERTGLDFKPYDTFGPDALEERQELYIRIAEWVWNPSRLDLDGVKPPERDHAVARPEGVPGGNSSREITLSDDDKERQAFWEALLAHANQHSDLHARISPNGEKNWLGANRQGQGWCYVALQNQTRVELYIDGSGADDNKALFDMLHAERERIEADFGDALVWQRLDDKRACRISFTVPEGWRERRTWESAIDRAVDAMGRLYGALAPRIAASRTTIRSR